MLLTTHGRRHWNKSKCNKSVQTHLPHEQDSKTYSVNECNKKEASQHDVPGLMKKVNCALLLPLPLGTASKQINQ
eukprot:4861199-Amphidinium_carterae.3